MKSTFLPFPTSKGRYACLLQLLLVFGGLLSLTRLGAQCNPDVTPPTAICNDIVMIALFPGPTTVVGAEAFDNGSFDNCCLDTILVRRQTDGPCDSDNLPDDFAGNITVCCADVGQPFVLELRAYDCAGNFNNCLVTVEVEDKTNPTCQAPANVTVSCEAFDPSLVAYGMPAVNDNCCIDTVLTTKSYAQFDSICNKGTITRTYKVYDCSGNSSQCSQKIVVNYAQYYFVRFPNDVIVTASSWQNGIYGEPVFYAEDCELLGTSYSDVIFNQVPDATYRIERTWLVINWCTYNPNLGFVTIPNPEPNADPNNPQNFQGPVVSAAGTPVPWSPSVLKVHATDPSPTNYSTFFDPNVNGYEYTQVIRVIDTFFVAVNGTVFVDSVANCDLDAGEMPLANWKVRATGSVTGKVKEASTDANGHYALLLSGQDTTFEVTLLAPFNYGGSCPSAYTLTANIGQTLTQNIPVTLQNTCPLLSVDLAAPFLRRCFPSTYTVQACNLSDQTVPDVHAEIELDTFLSFLSSPMASTALGNNTYSFDLGDMAPGTCQSFTINVLVQCSAPAGYTHCSTAHIYPDSLCPPPVNWSGANLEVTGHCDGDSVRFAITNVGAGNMAQPLDFVVVEDVIMFQTGQFQLNQTQSKNFVFPANGATWRVQADQEPNHPWGGVEAATVEGCGGLNTPGLVTQFVTNTPNPFESTDCQENIGSFDPNDKQAFPRGYGNAHLVEANTDLEYLIRFQNTGTDTAFTVAVLDTLSPYLDAKSVRPGVSSHPYSFVLLDGNVLRFQFDQIMLPDSNKNEPASHGFIKFRVSQLADNANGTQVTNQAAIYFDFNDPVLTNTTLHTIGDHFIVVKTDTPVQDPDALRVYPNPAGESVQFDLRHASGQSIFVLTDPFGKEIRRERFSGNSYRFERKGQGAGVYFFRIIQSDDRSYSGKLILK